MSAGTISAPIMIIGPDDARYLAACVPGIEKEYRQNGAIMPPQLRSRLADIVALSRVAPVPVQSSAPVPVEWIGTDEAARLLRLSERRVRALGDRLRRRKVLGAWLYDRADVLAEAEARTAE